MNRTASARLASALLATAGLATSVPLHAANGITVLHSFNYDDGQYPEGRLVQGLDGAFYGTTYGGGQQHQGEVFRVDASGGFSILHSFDGEDGQSLDSGLVLVDDGNFYGTTPQTVYCRHSICSGYGGTVFRIGTDGAFATLHTFMYAPGEGYQPGPLTVGSGDLLYGLTVQGGGPGGEGTAYAIATDGTLVTLATFDIANGGLPYGGLTRGADGNFYGTTSIGGANSKGTVFRMTPDGEITTLYSFTGGSDGDTPYGDLLQGSDGRFYGGASGGGDGAGTIFAITTTGALTVLHSFNGGDGTAPVDALVEGDDGDLYGVGGGGYQGYGTLYRLSKDGRRFMNLHLFATQDGTYPSSAPIFGNDGRLYGTTIQYGGSPGASGSVYAFDLSAPRVPELHLTKTCYNEFNMCLRPFNTSVGQYVSLDWASANVTACRASGAWNGSRPIGGHYKFQVTQRGAFLYRIDCIGPNGPTSAQVTLTVV
jgi:uncharacterized repeat protein (TIGR03803 family)